VMCVVGWVGFRKSCKSAKCQRGVEVGERTR
jgi:hypothetical protein